MALVWVYTLGWAYGFSVGLYSGVGLWL
jgi:hypothetical protein